jgi:hypothetical protein
MWKPAILSFVMYTEMTYAETGNLAKHVEVIRCITPVTCVLRIQTSGEYPAEPAGMKKPLFLQTSKCHLVLPVLVKSRTHVTFGSLAGKHKHTGPLPVWVKHQGGDSPMRPRRRRCTLLSFGSLQSCHPQLALFCCSPLDSRRLDRPEPCTDVGFW